MPWSSPAAWSALRSSSATMSGVAPDSDASTARPSAHDMRRRRSRSHVSRSRTVLRVGISAGDEKREDRRRAARRGRGRRGPRSRRSGRRSRASAPGPKRSSRSHLFLTTMRGIPNCRAKSAWSSGSRGDERSTSTSTRSARCAAASARRTPSASISSAGARSPAVSMSRTGIPPIEATSSTVSRVVPGRRSDDRALFGQQRVRAASTCRRSAGRGSPR